MYKGSCLSLLPEWLCEPDQRVAGGRSAGFEAQGGGAGPLGQDVLDDARAVPVLLLIGGVHPRVLVGSGRVEGDVLPDPGGLALYAGIEDWPATQRNLGRYLFLHPAAREIFPDWDNQIRHCVARLRALAGTDPDAPDLTQLVGELLVKSPDFAKLWDRYDVTGRKITTKTFQHPRVGKITLAFQGMALEGTPGHRLGVYTAEPGTPDHDAMLLLDMTAPHSVEPAPSQQKR